MGFRVQGLGGYFGVYIGIIEKKMETASFEVLDLIGFQAYSPGEHGPIVGVKTLESLELAAARVLGFMA